MKTYAAVFAAALAMVTLASNTADAQWAYRRIAPTRFYVSRPVVVTSAYPTIYPYPMTTTVVAPNVVIGPLGRVHYVAPIRPVVTPVYLGY
jgi:hypothetical protein